MRQERISATGRGRSWSVRLLPQNRPSIKHEGHKGARRTKVTTDFPLEPSYMSVANSRMESATDSSRENACAAGLRLEPAVARDQSLACTRQGERSTPTLH